MDATEEIWWGRVGLRDDGKSRWWRGEAAEIVSTTSKISGRYDNNGCIFAFCIRLELSPAEWNGGIKKDIISPGQKCRQVKRTNRRLAIPRDREVYVHARAVAVASPTLTGIVDKKIWFVQLPPV